MEKVYNDVIEIRGGFETIERKLLEDTQQGVKKHGIVKVLSVLADMARIREELRALSEKLS